MARRRKGIKKKASSGGDGGGDGDGDGGGGGGGSGSGRSSVGRDKPKAIKASSGSSAGGSSSSLVVLLCMLLVGFVAVWVVYGGEESGRAPVEAGAAVDDSSAAAFPHAGDTPLHDHTRDGATIGQEDASQSPPPPPTEAEAVSAAAAVVAEVDAADSSDSAEPTAVEADTEETGTALDDEDTMRDDADVVDDSASVDLLPVIWFAPFLSGGGYCAEAISFVAGLQEHTDVQIVQHGDGVDQRFVQGLDRETGQMINRLARNRLDSTSSVVICHSEPGAWYPPKYQTSYCPPLVGSKVKIGRTMFETDRVPEGWAERLNKMDQVWVPTKFHYNVFSVGGVDESRLRIIPEAVDTDFFKPAALADASADAGGEDVERFTLPYERPEQFKFLSIFKFEERKGWRFLLEAYFREFSANHDVVLYILTNQYHSDAKFKEKIDEYVATLDGVGEDLPAVHVLPEGIPTRQMPGVYQSCDCFVLPSRGEGWGRPQVEAMASGLPVIATAWSGPEAYLSEQNGYPLRVDSLEAIPDGAFKGHMWAKPSVEHLRQLMRRVYDNRDEASAKGAQARRDMEDKFCQRCVTDIVVRELRQLNL